ncbi:MULTISPECIES: GNAT family N-acetyltransferase [unclassified Mycolicibacterium]|uniref:GNAT family N-acetyltransferase n=1 Tax=unclassified Mycolicibacterium TaxID=2636767 RepID=UPI002EDB4FA9
MDELIEEFEDPMFDAGRDGIIGLDETGRAVACGTVTRSSINETIVWIQLEGTVHPDRRGEGIGTILLDWQERRGLQQLAASEETLPGWLTADVSEHAVAAAHLLTAQGFHGVRWWFDMERDLSAPLPDVALPADVRLVDYTPDTSEAARVAFNEAFRDHWGSQPHTAEEWAKSDKRSEFRADLSTLVSVANGNADEEIAAVLSTEVPEHEWEARGSKFAHISGVAVRRPWRGRGIARALIVNAMHAYRDAGLEVAALSVDTENPTGALGLYESLGFAPTERSTTFIKAF